MKLLAASYLALCALFYFLDVPSPEPALAFFISLLLPTPFLTLRIFSRKDVADLSFSISFFALAALVAYFAYALTYVNKLVAVFYASVVIDTVLTALLLVKIKE